MAAAYPGLADDFSPDDPASPEAAVPGTPAPLDLNIPLTRTERDELARRICDEIDHYRYATARRRANLSQWRHDWECVPTGRSNRWVGSADIPSPHTRIYCNSHHTRLNTQIISPKPPFAAVARRPDALEAAPIAEEALAAILDAADWPVVADELHQELVIAGNCFLRIAHEQEWTRVPKKEVDFSDEDAGALIRAGIPPHEALWQSVKKLKFGHEDVCTFDGVKMKPIPFEDGIILPASVRDPEKAYGIGERLRLTGAELKAGAKQGIYDAEEVEELLKSQGSSLTADRRERLDDSGIAPDGQSRMGAHDSLYREYEAYELCWQGDFDDDGQMEWARLLVVPECRKLLRCQYLDYEHGRPCYMLFRYITRTNELFGIGIPELIACYTDADTANLCALTDHADLVLALGLFLYDNTAGLDPTKFMAQLGTPIRVENLDGIKQFPPVQMPAEHYNMRGVWKDICDLLTAASNPSLGKVTDTSKTLGEVQIVQNASSMIFEDYAARVARVWAKAWDHVRWLAAQFGAKDEQGGVLYRRTAAPDMTEFDAIPPEMLTAAIDLLPAGLEQLSDIQTRIQINMLVRNAFMADPLVQGNLEALLILDEAMLEALRYPKRRQLLAAMKKQAAAQQAVQQMELMVGGMGQGPEGPPGGAPPPAGPAPAGAPPAALGRNAPPPIPKGLRHDIHEQTAQSQGTPAPGTPSAPV